MTDVTQSLLQTVRSGITCKNFTDKRSTCRYHRRFRAMHAVKGSTLHTHCIITTITLTSNRYKYVFGVAYGRAFVTTSVSFEL